MSVQRLEFDVVVVGGGPNGLVAAAYLQKAGLKVLLLERRYELGGTLTTEDLGGFRANLHHNYYMLYADVAPPFSDLALSEHAVTFVRPEVIAAVHDSGDPLLVYRDPRINSESFARRSPGDGQAFERLYSDISQARDKIMLPQTYATPTTKSYLDALAKIPEGKKMLELAEMSPLGVLEHYGFKDDLIKAALLYLGCRWGLEPNAKGQGDLFTYYLSNALNLAIIRGGSYMLINGLAYDAYGAGLETFLVCEAQRIKISKNINEVHTSDNRIINARLIVSTAGLKKTFLEMLEGVEVPSEVRRIAESWKPNDWSILTINSGIKEGPNFKAEEKNPNIKKALMHIVGLSSPEALVKALSSDSTEPPLFNFSIPTFFDTTQAARGMHLLRFEAEVPFMVQGGWKEAGRRYAETIKQAFSELLSNSQRLRFIRDYLFPPEWIPKKFPNIREGSVWGGKIGDLNDRLSLAALYDSMEGIVYAGHDAYPRGPLSLAQGYIAAAKSVYRLKARLWWKEPVWLTESRKLGLIK